MSNLQFPDLSIERYRGFKQLAVSQLGRVTLITGKNNTGKSSVLEALRLHVQNAAPYSVHSILTYREEYIRGMDEEDHSYDPESVFHVSALFNGFPGIHDDFGPISIATSGKSRRMVLTMRVAWLSEVTDSDGNRRLIPEQQTMFDESELVPALVAKTEDGEHVWPLEAMHRQARLRRGPRPRPSDRVRMPCIFTSPYSGGGTDLLGPLWDEIALTDNESDVVDALRIIDPRISAIRMIGGEGPSKTRTAIVRAENIGRPVPLRSFGDGLNRLFSIILSLVNAQGGILLIDEFENGLHHTVQSDAWRVIFRLAQTLEVQVFATSHSWDAVEAFQKAAAETPEEGVLLRLTRWDDDIVPTVFAEDELAVATRHNIEVR